MFLPNQAYDSVRTHIRIAVIFKSNKICKALWETSHYGMAPVDPCRPQNRGSHDYLRAHKGSRRMSRPLIQDSSVSVLFP